MHEKRRERVAGWEEGGGGANEEVREREREEGGREDPALCCETRARKNCSEFKTLPNVFPVVTVWRRSIA